MSAELPPEKPDSSIPPRTTGGGWRWAPPTPEDLQQQLTNYIVESLLGHGGMGAVYRGLQKGLERPVAIKILPPGIEKEDPSYAERFKNEAKLMARLEHPGIVPVYEFGQTASGLLYFVMGFVDGSDVHQLLRAAPLGRLPPEHALAITAHVCDALSYAHDHGIVHRDIKPANILINTAGQVKVADFGLAKLDDPAERGFTQTGLAMGTPDYVAPEVLILGTRIDGRADLYAMGVMLYQMLTGHVPRGAFKPASQRIPNLDPRLDAIIQKAMQSDREDRFQTSGELRAALEPLFGRQMSEPELQQYTTGVVRQTIPVRDNPREPKSKPKQSKSAHHQLPWLIGSAVAIGIIVFMMLGGDEAPKPVSETASEASKASSPVIAAASTPPALTLASEPSKRQPKPTEPPKAPDPSPPPPVAKSSEPQFPLGKWVKTFTKLEDLPAEVRKPDSGVRFEDGRLIVAAASSKTIACSPFEFSNGGIRLKLAPNSPEMHLFLSKPDHTNVRLFVSPTVDEISVQRWKPNFPRIDLGRQTAPRSRERSLEIVVVGKTLIARVDDQITFAQIPEQESISPFKPLVLLNHTSIRDIEVINLDGIPEAEALKILGVDEKGNDLRQPAAVAASPPSLSVSTTPSLPVPASSDPKFPPGQWVKVLTKAEDLPSALRKADSGVKFEDGWLVPGANKLSVSLPQTTLSSEGRLRNRGIRATLMRTDAATYTQLAIRDTTGSQHYIALKRDGILNAQWQSVNGQSSSDLATPQVPLPIAMGATYRLEIAIVGSRLISRVDDTLNPVAEAKTNEGGGVFIYGDRPLRDIEVINLDGIPEAEALRILGVDEKGNDLRSLAAKQELQQMEQAKVADAMAAIPELKTLHEQFVKLTTERVNAPFEADEAKLNTGYVGGLDREIAHEKKAGHLDGVIVLEAEKQLIFDKQPLPAKDDEATLTNLKALRQIYRDAFSKLEATRAANHKALTDPLSIRLKQLESTLTQQNRIDHAKTVREYRENLGEEGTPDESAGIPSAASQPARNATTGTATAKMNESDKGARTPASKLSHEEIVKWVLSRQGKITIEKSGQKTTIEAGIAIPSGSFKILKVDLNKTTGPRDPIPDTELVNLSGLKDMRELHLEGRSGFTGSFLASLSASRDLETLSIGVGSFQPEHLKSVSLFPNLIRMRVAGGPVAEALVSLPSLRKLQSLAIHGVPTPEMLQSLVKHPELTNLRCISRDWKVEHFKAMAGIKTLTSLELQSFPREPETFVILTPLSKLESVHFSTSIKAEQLSGLETFKNLNRVVLNLDNVTDDAEQVAAKLALCRSLETVDLLTGTPDNEKFIKTAEVIQKALSKVKVVLRRP